MTRSVHTLALALLLVAAGASGAGGQTVEITAFGGYAYPTYSQEFRFDTPEVPALPGIAVTPEGELTLEASGGPVFGAAVAFEWGGFLAIEGRYDPTAIELVSSGARYVISGLIDGAITFGDGPVPVDRLQLVSLNLRVRTPGTVSFVASGGLSYLPDFTVGGAIPLRIELAGSALPDVEVPLRLVVAPTDSEHRFGVNGGLGLRVRVSPRVSLVGEIRGFYFREYELVVESIDLGLGALVEDLGPVRFDPIVVNAVGGVSFSF